ncbi:MAG: type II toxin-antitoxin system PemK/MazF family toxin [Solirubrobacteraceae bacterium]
MRLRAGVAGLQTDSKAQAEQVRAVALERIGEALGELPPALLSSLEETLRLHLAL